jgi:hypothetical protein
MLLVSEEPLFELNCEACTWHKICGPLEIEKLLRSAGHLRRAEKPAADLVRELLAGVAPQLPCPDCGTAGLRMSPFEDEDDWATARRCEICRQPIPAERLEALPNAKSCLNCQQAEETGQSHSEAEYCPRCGALLELRVSRRGGLTRYQLFCTGQPPCRPR